MTRVEKIAELAWINKSTLTEKEIQTLKAQVTFRVTDGFGKTASNITEVYETAEYLGFPRAWAENYLHASGALDCTTYSKVCAPIVWPTAQVKQYWSGQQEAIDEAVQKLVMLGDGFFRGKAGSGKTLMGLSIAAKLGQRTLVVVNKQDLAVQWIDTLEKFFPTATFGHVQQDVQEYRDHHLVTATAQTLYSRVKNNELVDLHEQFGFVILDEGHKFPADTFRICAAGFPARYRLAMSATFRRNDGKLAILESHMKRFQVEAKTEHLTGKYTTLKTEKQHPKKRLNEPAYAYRNRWLKSYTEDLHLINQVAQVAEKAVDQGRKVLIVSDRVQHLKYLEAAITKKVSKYYGRYTDAQEDIVLGTYAKIAEGTDVPRLDTVILATPRRDVEQVVGRIQRQHPDKQEPLAIIVKLLKSPSVTSQLERLGFNHVEWPF